MSGEIKTISDFRTVMRTGSTAWPGGYPLYFIMGDGEPLSFRAAKENRRALLEALRDKDVHPRDQWLPVAVDVNWEDTNLICSHRGEKIESAYGE